MYPVYSFREKSFSEVYLREILKTKTDSYWHEKLCSKSESQINLEKGWVRAFHSKWHRSTRWRFSFNFLGQLYFFAEVVEVFLALYGKTCINLE